MSSFYSVPGSPGPQGPEGPAGEGVPAGGTTGQTLVKTSNTDYDTEWADATGGGSATPAGSAGELQINDGLSPAGLGAVTGLKWDSANSELDVPGDITLDDGIAGPVTTLQTITPTQDNTISLPNATGTVALVAGSSGQPIYNNAGKYAGLSTATIGSTGNISLSLNGASGVAPVAVTGSWFVGTTPQVLIQPSGTTSPNWSPNGTGLGVNAASGFTGNLLDLQLNGTSQYRINSDGYQVTTKGYRSDYVVHLSGTGFEIYRAGANQFSLTKDIPFAWTSSGGAADSGLRDLLILRDAAGTLAQRNGANAQTTRLYNTYTSSSIYERLSTTWDSGVCYTKPENAGAGTTARIYVPVTGATTVGNLPAAATAGAGARAFVTDADSTTFLATAVGGGSNKVPVVSDGTTWLIG